MAPLSNGTCVCSWDSLGGARVHACVSLSMWCVVSSVLQLMSTMTGQKVGHHFKVFDRCGWYFGGAADLGDPARMCFGRFVAFCTSDISWQGVVSPRTSEFLFLSQAIFRLGRWEKLALIYSVLLYVVFLVFITYFLCSSLVFCLAKKKT